MRPQIEEQRVLLARDGHCQAEYRAAGNAVQVRVGSADIELSPAEFLSVCATLLKAARTLGRQPYIPGLARVAESARRHRERKYRS
ncbi:MAG TPA: hypothetical protein VIL43_08055 [Burkholderiales bacterium]